MVKKKAFLLLFLVIVILLLSNLSFAAKGGTVTQGKGQGSKPPADAIVLTSCRTINQAGTYDLDRDLVTTGTCIVVNSSNVIINGKRYKITGNGQWSGARIPYSGISILNYNNISVRDLKLNDFDQAIFIKNSSNNLIENNFINKTLNVGLDLSSVSNTKVISNSISNSAYIGLWIGESSKNNLVLGNNFSIAVYGIRVGAYSSNNSLLNNTITLVGTGINFAGYSNFTFVKNNVIFNSSTAISSVISRNNTIYDTVLYSNVQDVFLEYESLGDIFVNVSYNISREFVDSLSDLTRKWYFDLKVVNSSGSLIGGASVVVKNALGATLFNLLTDVNGRIPRQELIEYVNSNNVRNYLSPYRIEVSKIGYDNYFYYETINTSTSKIVGLQSLSPSINSDLIGHWKFDEQFGSTTLIDSSGRSNNGVCSGINCPLTGVMGKVGPAALFNGNNYVSIGKTTGFSNGRTKAFWIKPATVIRGNYYIVDEGGNNNWVQLYDVDDDGKLELRAGQSGYSYANGIFEFTVPNVWYFVVVTINASNVQKTYVNGNLDASGNVASNSPSVITVGKWGGGSSFYFNGTVDELRIWNRTLSATEISSIYQKELIEFSCLDSDKGKNYYQIGNASEVDANGFKRNEIQDYCSGSLLREAYCNATRGEYKDVSCVNGCQSGMCIGNKLNVTIGIATLKDNYNVNEEIDVTDPPELDDFVRIDKANGSLEGNYGYTVELKEKPLAVKYKELKEKQMSFVGNVILTLFDILNIDSGVSELKAYKEKLILDHKNAKEKIKAKLGKGDVIFKEEYYNALNGFVVEVDDREAVELSEIGEINNIEKVRIGRGNLMDSVPWLNVDDVWRIKDGLNRNITGKGAKIAILDSGIDYTHPSFGSCTTQQFLAENCAKVPVGYDFVTCDAISLICGLPRPEDSDPMDDMGHGTHVSGIAAGNGTLKGVAPDAQIYAYKVLNVNNEGLTSWFISGIDRALDPNNDGNLVDHVDVISMSLGIGCGGGYNENCGPDDMLGKAVDRATLAGSVVVVAAGNGGPNAGTISSPGTARTAITVGSSVNDFGTISKLYVNNLFMNSIGGQRSRLTNGNLIAEVKNVSGDGTPEDFLNSGNFVGKIALVRRGTLWLYEKVRNSYNAGAVGVIIYNNVAGEFYPTFTNLTEIPAIGITQQDGNNLLNMLASGQVSANISIVKNNTFAYTIKDYSSRGPIVTTNEILIKPDVVVPGYLVCSARYDSFLSGYECLSDKYVVYDGTSMAAPHVSGLVALLKQKNPDWNSEEIKMAIRSKAIDSAQNSITVEGYGKADALRAIQFNGIPSIASIKTSGKIGGIIDVYGSAKGRQFKNYTLYYGEGYDPSSWVVLKQGSVPVDNGILYSDFSTLSLVGKSLTLRLIVTNTNGEESEDRSFVDVTRPQSKIVNKEEFSEIISGMLRMRLEKLSNEAWILDSNVVNQEIFISRERAVKLDSYWNPVSVRALTSGQYRTFVEFDVGFDKVNSTWSFTIL